MNPAPFRSFDPRRGLLVGLLFGTVIFFAGLVNAETVGTSALFAGIWGLVAGWVGCFRAPPREPTDAERMRWVFGLVFRRFGRGGR
jgi:hypothetical protein